MASNIVVDVDEDDRGLDRRPQTVDNNDPGKLLISSKDFPYCNLIGGQLCLPSINSLSLQNYMETVFNPPQIPAKYIQRLMRSGSIAQPSAMVDAASKILLVQYYKTQGITQVNIERNSDPRYHGLFHIKSAKTIAQTNTPGSFFLANENNAGEIHISLLFIHSDKSNPKFYFDSFGDCPYDIKGLDGLVHNSQRFQDVRNKTCAGHCYYVREQFLEGLSWDDLLRTYHQTTSCDDMVIEYFIGKRQQDIERGIYCEYQQKKFFDLRGQEIPAFERRGCVDGYLDKRIRRNGPG